MHRSLNSLMIFLLALCILMIEAADTHATVCRRPGLEGYDAAKARGERVLPDWTTSDIRKAIVYIEMTKDGPWYQSNFITKGFEYATKIGNEGNLGASDAFANIVFTPDMYKKDRSLWSSAEEAFTKDAQILVDKSVFNTDGTSKIDLGNARNIKVVDGKEGKTIGAVEMLNRMRPPPLFMSRALGCCFFGMPPYMIKSLVSQLRSKAFRKKSMTLVSLARDTATEHAIANSASLSRLAKRSNGQAISSKDYVFQIIKQATGGTVVLLGHVEGTSFAVRSSSGQLRFKVELAELHQLAKAREVDLIALGCETAKNVERESFGSGVINKFNTVEAVKKLEESIEKSKNYADFFENLTGPGLKIVAFEHVLKLSGRQESVLSSSIYSKIRGPLDRSLQVARVYLLGAAKALRFERSTLRVAEKGNTELERSTGDWNEKLNDLLEEHGIKRPE